MITTKQLTKLQAYASSLDHGISVDLVDKGTRVDIRHNDELFISLNNRTSSRLSMKSVQHHIDNCAKKS